MSILQGILEARQALSQIEERQNMSRYREIEGQARMMEMDMRRRAQANEEQVVRIMAGDVSQSQQGQQLIDPKQSPVQKMNPIAAQIQYLDAQIQQNDKRRKALLTTPGGFQHVEKLDRDDERLINSRTRLQTQFEKEQNDFRGNVASTAYAMRTSLEKQDPDAAMEVYRTASPEVRKMLNLNEDENGNPVFDARSSKKMGAIAASMGGLKAQELEQNRESKIAAEAAENQRKKDRDRADAANKALVLALRQQGLSQHEEYKKGQADKDANKNADKTFNNAQAIIDRTAVTNHFDEAQRNYEEAKSLADQVINASPKELSYLAPRLLKLKSAFASQLSGYRSRAGSSKIENNDIKSLNDAFTKMENYFKTLGSATPVLGKTAAEGIINVFNESFKIANKAMVRTSLEQYDRVQSYIENQKERGITVTADADKMMIKGDVGLFVEGLPSHKHGVLDDGRVWVDIGVNQQRLIALPLGSL